MGMENLTFNPPHFSTDFEAEYDRYRLHHAGEICTQLKALSRRPEIVTAYFRDVSSYLLTAVLDVMRERDLLVLDFGQDTVHTQKAIEAGRLHCTANHGGVPIHFSCERLQSARYQSRPVIAAAIPQRMYRIQRRDYFRVTTPRINGPQCEIVDLQGGKSHLLTICDISVGGIGLLSRDGEAGIAVHQRYRACRIYLPTMGVIEVDLTLRYAIEKQQSNEGICMRYGAAFEGLSPADSAAIQRYIFFLQSCNPA